MGRGNVILVKARSDVEPGSHEGEELNCGGPDTSPLSRPPHATAC